jgi:hypothetical protein
MEKLESLKIEEEEEVNGDSKDVEVNGDANGDVTTKKKRKRTKKKKNLEDNPEIITETVIEPKLTPLTKQYPNQNFPHGQKLPYPPPYSNKLKNFSQDQLAEKKALEKVSQEQYQDLRRAAEGNHNN